jgi:NADH-quinone oxidoreductase subunit D
VAQVCEQLDRALPNYDELLTDNPIFRQRTVGIGRITSEQALALGVTGPALRATGYSWDLRKHMPYAGYEQYDFEVPVGTNGDVYDRFVVRRREVDQSLRLVRQGLERLPEGPTISDDRKLALPPREELDLSMEALIHHFLLVSRGFQTPIGEVYVAVESSRGELGFYLVSDGTGKPYRCHFRSPSFVNLQAMDTMARGHLVADLVAIIASLDVIMGDCDR